MSINARSDAAGPRQIPSWSTPHDCRFFRNPRFLLQPFWEPVDDGAPNEVGSLGTGIPELKAAPDAPSSKSRQVNSRTLGRSESAIRGCRYPLVA